MHAVTGMKLQTRVRELTWGDGQEGEGGGREDGCGELQGREEVAGLRALDGYG